MYRSFSDELVKIAFSKEAVPAWMKKWESLGRTAKRVMARRFGKSVEELESLVQGSVKGGKGRKGIDAAMRNASKSQAIESGKKLQRLRFNLSASPLSEKQIELRNRLAQNAVHNTRDVYAIPKLRFGGGGFAASYKGDPESMFPDLIKRLQYSDPSAAKKLKNLLEKDKSLLKAERGVFVNPDIGGKRLRSAVPHEQGELRLMDYNKRQTIKTPDGAAHAGVYPLSEEYRVQLEHPEIFERLNRTTRLNSPDVEPGLYDLFRQRGWVNPSSASHAYKMDWKTHKKLTDEAVKRYSSGKRMLSSDKKQLSYIEGYVPRANVPKKAPAVKPRANKTTLPNTPKPTTSPPPKVDNTPPVKTDVAPPTQSVETPTSSTVAQPKVAPSVQSAPISSSPPVTATASSVPTSSTAGNAGGGGWILPAAATAVAVPGAYGAYRFLRRPTGDR